MQLNLPVTSVYGYFDWYSRTAPDPDPDAEPTEEQIIADEREAELEKYTWSDSESSMSISWNSDYERDSEANSIIASDDEETSNA